MRLGFSFAAVLLVANSAICSGEASPVASSGNCAYELDTVCDWPRAIKTEADIAALRKAVYRAGDSLSATAPDGTVTVSEKAAGCKEAFGFGAGGLWTFANERQKGVVSFTVRHSIYGTSGDGTESSPAELVDAEELADLVEAGTAGNGYFFTLVGDSLLAALQLPGGYCLSECANGLFRMNGSEDGRRYVCSGVAYSVDAKQSGPNRRICMQDVLPVAYSGDGWRRNPEKVSTLTTIDPDEAENSFEFAGTGASPLRFGKFGVWKLRLEMESGEVCEAYVNICKKFFAVTVR